jgi:flagellar biosynthesis protein FliQ
LVAVLLSRAARFLVKKGLTSIGLDKRLAAGAELEEGGTSTSTALSEAAHYLILLLFVPAILETLSLHGLLQPVSAMFETALSFVPNLVAAVAILVIGWFVARVLRQLSSALLASLGVDRLAERLGLREVTPDGKLSSALSTVIYAVVLIPVFIAALDALQLDALTEPTSQMLQQLLEAVPNILGAVLILGITWVVAKIVSELLRTLSANIGVDGLAKRLGVAGLDGGVKISSAIGHLVLAAILLFGSMEAFNTLGFELLSAMVFEIIEFASQVLLGVLILAVGLYVSQLAATVITSSRMAHSGLLATLARGAILVLAGAMALRRMGLANDIVNAAFIALLGAIAVAAALAFGLGGRQTAGSLLEEWRAALNAKRAAALESVAEPTESVSTPPVIADPTATE